MYNRGRGEGVVFLARRETIRHSYHAGILMSDPFQTRAVFMLAFVLGGGGGGGLAGKR